MPPVAPQSFQRPWFAVAIPAVLAPRWRFPSLLALLLFSLWFPWQIMATLHLGAYLGPGLGDALSYEYIQTLWSQADATSPYAGWAVRLGFVLLGVWIAAITFFSAIRYEKSVGQAFPWGKFWQLLLLNAVLAISLLVCTVLLALLLWASGLDFVQAYAFVGRTAVQINDWVYANVPTVVQLPRVLAFLLIYTIAGFFHYWLHRVGHQFRIGWLLFHRPHHMPTVLTHPTTPPVFAAFPLFIVAFVPYVLIFGAISKLFYPEPLYAELIVYNALAWVGGVFGHQTAYYDWAYKNKFFYALSAFFGNGVHHYTHHAKEQQYSRYGSNMVNIGGGFLYLWDRLFGTYCKPPAKRPEVGLSEGVELHGNPVRLAYAGVLQLLYELRHNKGWRTRLQIVLGSSEWQPPISKNFALA